jgi:hypothetical protein
MGYHRKKKGETPKSPPGWCIGISDQLITGPLQQHHEVRIPKYIIMSTFPVQIFFKPYPTRFKIILIHPYSPTGFGHHG